MTRRGQIRVGRASLLKAADWRRWLLMVFGCLSVGPVFGQLDSLPAIGPQFERYNRQALHEKLFLHLDRPLYMSGETVWFGVYAVDGTLHRPLPLSRVAYVEVLDEARRPVRQAKIALREASGHGSLLLPADLPTGSYLVRGYTSWMRNFNPEGYYQQPITVVNARAVSGKPTSVPAGGAAVQFFPEGGHLVRGLTSKVAFEVTDAAGRSVAAEGAVLDARGREVVRFRTQRFGRGHFLLTPSEAGRSYTAVLRPAGSAVSIRQTLPPVYSQGYVLGLTNQDAENLRLTVQATADAAPDVYLLAHARQQVLEAGVVHLTNGRATVGIPKSKLPAGVAHFTLFNARKQPLCERLYFRRPTRTLRIAATPDQPRYATRQRVSLQLSTTDGTAPVPAALSVAVYRLDSLAHLPATDISSYLWLTSDLRGTVENPDYYLNAPQPEAEAAADDLMLTQGWSRFRWEEVWANAPASFRHEPELNGHFIGARLVHRSTRQPAAGITAYLTTPGQPVRLASAVSRPDGRLYFEVADLFGTKEVVVTTNERVDSTYQLELLNPFSTRYAERRLSPVHFGPADRAALAQRHLQRQTQQAYFGRYSQQLRPLVLDSLPFYGQPSASYLLSDYTRFPTLEEVMREYVPGVQVRRQKGRFHFRVVDMANQTVLRTDPLVLVDGLPVFDMEQVMGLDPLRIRRLDVVTSRYLHGQQIYNGVVSYTTYRGDVAGLEPTPRALLQAYEGLQRQREFYAPRYHDAAARQSRLADLRHLLYWQPEVRTTTSPAQLDFYTSDQAGKYLVVVQGLSAGGLTGNARFVIEVTTSATP